MKIQNTKAIMVRVPVHVYESLSLLARERGYTSVSALARRSIEDYVWRAYLNRK